MHTCEICRQKASLELTENGVSSWFCLPCLKSSSELGDIAQWLVSLRPQQTRLTMCPSCGWTVDKVEQTGHVGCPLCYESLDSPLLVQLERPKNHWTEV